MKQKLTYLIFVIFFIFQVNGAKSQQVLNGSFEGKYPLWAELADDWDACNDYNQNSPDIFPGDWWNVVYPASK